MPEELEKCPRHEFDEMKNIRYLMHFSVNLKRLICIITKVIGSRFIGLSWKVISYAKNRLLKEKNIC